MTTNRLFKFAVLPLLLLAGFFSFEGKTKAEEFGQWILKAKIC